MKLSEIYFRKADEAAERGLHRVADVFWQFAVKLDAEGR